jgi:hypothetical protein
MSSDKFILKLKTWSFGPGFFTCVFTIKKNEGSICSNYRLNIDVAA